MRHLLFLSDAVFDLFRKASGTLYIRTIQYILLNSILGLYAFLQKWTSRMNTIFKTFFADFYFYMSSEIL